MRRTEVIMMVALTVLVFLASGAMAQVPEKIPPWDFNAPGGVPGFGPLTTDGSSRLIARTMEQTESFDPERLGAERLTHDQPPVLTGEALQANGPGQVK